MRTELLNRNFATTDLGSWGVMTGSEAPTSSGLMEA